MGRAKRWQEIGITDGVGEIRFLKWRYFIEYIHQEMLDFEQYIWRGQRNSDWGLITTLDRLMIRAKIAKTKRSNFRFSHLEQFKYSVRGRRGPNPATIDTQNEWWALGQHHGLATPLLDWTTSPFAAAYFAFINIGQSQTRYRTVFAITKPGIEAKAHTIWREATRVEQERVENAKNSGHTSQLALMPQTIEHEVVFIRPKSDENQRLVNQSGLFSRAPDENNLDEWVSKNFTGESKAYTLMKLMIPNSDRTECLRTLNRMNINHLTLFPDLYGASKFCNLYGEIDKY